MTPLEQFIAEHEATVESVREYIRLTLFAVAAIAVFVYGCWVFA